MGNQESFSDEKYIVKKIKKKQTTAQSNQKTLRQDIYKNNNDIEKKYQQHQDYQENQNYFEDQTLNEETIRKRNQKSNHSADSNNLHYQSFLPFSQTKKINERKIQNNQYFDAELENSTLLNRNLNMAIPSRNNAIMDYPTASRTNMVTTSQATEFVPYNINDSVTKIEENLKKEETDFELEQEKRRKEFEKNQKYKKEYLKNQIKKFETEHNPWEVLGLEQDDYDINNIKKAYKKNALKYHPDKAGKKYEDRFSLITQSYIYLLNKAEEYIAIQTKTSKPVEKIDYEDDVNEQVENIYINKDNFDLTKFNKIFDKYKVPDSFDKGYSDLMKNDFKSNPSSERIDNQVFGKKFNNDIFNEHFNQQKQKKSQDIIEYTDPNAFQSANQLSLGMLGIDNVEDFGCVNNNSLSYTDYKKAHIDETLLIDVNKVKYKTHKSIDDLEHERSKLSYTATPEDRRRYDLLEKKRLEEDNHRMAQQRQYDAMIEKQYTKLNKKLIVHKE